MASLFLSARSALRLSKGERREAIRAWLWLVAARIALIWVPYGSIEQLVARLPGRVPINVEPSAECHTRAVKRAARLVPACGCLPQAIAAQCLLRREGQPSRIVFGVAQNKDGTLDAHAWLWHDGRILVGGEVAGRYAPLTTPPTS